jgi:HEPN domain-containing protein
MNNGERGRRLIAMATEYLQDMEASYGRKSCNAVVRRAQEVVELALKSVLSYLGVDFPKVHDPAAVFIATLSARGMALSAHEAEDVRNVSAALARKRAPAFYFEQIEDESAAEEAAADARRIHRICARLVAAIESELPEPHECGPERTSSEGESSEGE